MPYLILAGVAVIMLMIALWPPVSPVRLSNLLLTGGAITLGDLWVNGLFDWYTYRPGLLPGRADDYLGVLLAECVFVPSLFCLLAMIPMPWRPWVKAAVVVPIELIEVLFQHLGVYEMHQWRHWHTVVLFLLYGLVSALWTWSFQRKGYTRFHRAVMVGAITYYTMNLWALIPTGILKLFWMQMGLGRNLREDIVLSTMLLHGTVCSVTCILVQWNRWNRTWRQLLAVGAALSGYFWLLAAVGLARHRWFWHPVMEGVTLTLIMYGHGHIDRWFARHAPPRRQVKPWVPPQFEPR